MTNLIPPVHGIGSSPHQNQNLNYWADWLELGHNEDAGAPIALVQPIPKMTGHRPAIMCDENTFFLCGHFQDLGIGQADDAAFHGRSEFDGGFPEPHRLDDSITKIGVRLEADQARDSPDGDSVIRALARSSLAHNSGFSTERGVQLAVNSRSESSRYLSISA